MPATPLPPAASTAAPRTVGGYALVTLLGSGALGDVYRAVAAAGGEPVALKLMRLPTDGQALHDARSAFLAEAAAARRLQHPGIVRVLAAGEHQSRAWLVMELLAGHDLQRHTRAPALLPVPLALRLAQRVSDALSHAHRAGVLHRDIKPANVVVDVQAERATLTDFGLARIADAERTRTGLLLGTPAYMAPELLAGAPASAASDLYAFGVLLFELLAGRRPHDAATMGALLRQVAGEPAPALDALRAGLPLGTSALVASLLAKRPQQRPAQAADVAARLAAIAAQITAR